MDLQNIRFSSADIDLKVKKLKLPRHKNNERFLKGPIPMKWLKMAAQLPGKSLHVSLALWHLAGMTNSTTVKLTGATLNMLSIKRYAGYRAVRALEQVGLIRVIRGRGCCPLITILACPAGDQ